LDLVLVNETDNCTVYSIQFLSEDESEFERFYNKFKDDAEYNPDLMRVRPDWSLDKCFNSRKLGLGSINPIVNQFIQRGNSEGSVAC